MCVELAAQRILCLFRPICVDSRSFAAKKQFPSGEAFYRAGVNPSQEGSAYARVSFGRLDLWYRHTTPVSPGFPSGIRLPFGQQRTHRVQHVREQVGVIRLLAGQQPLHMLTPGRGGETRGAAIRHDRQARRARKVSGLPFPTVDQGADDTDVSLIVQVPRLHSPQLSAVEEGHQQALGQVVQMLRQGQHPVALAATGAIEDAPLHTRAVGAERVPVHPFLGLLQDGLLLVEPGHPEAVVVVSERSGLESGYLRIDRDDPELEAHRGVGSKVAQDGKQRQRVFTAGDAEQDAVAVADHVILGDGPPDLTQE